jgi:hypothetical protein
MNVRRALNDNNRTSACRRQAGALWSIALSTAARAKYAGVAAGQGYDERAPGRRRKPKALRASRTNRAVSMITSIRASISACMRSSSREQGPAWPGSTGRTSAAAADHRQKPGAHSSTRLAGYGAAYSIAPMNRGPGKACAGTRRSPLQRPPHQCPRFHADPNGTVK